ncbi:MAG: DUF4093 domain-containing protein [Clostridia bacterium]|nr:DUF4093 domain-containing protein [Clostridia bacterium]
MIHVDRVIVVEGKYDRIALSKIIDGVIVETGGFGIFSDHQRLEMIRTLAKEKGLILLTDSDRSGMAIRNYLIGAIGPQYIQNAYIPDCYGKEKRKLHPSSEGKLGVEGMSESTLLSILKFASAPKNTEKEPITNADLYNAGLLGNPESKRMRMKYQQALGLPAHLSPRKFSEILNLLRSREEFLREIEELLR